MYLPKLPPSDYGYCVDLWYNMYGENAGMLMVNDGDFGVDTIFGDQGGFWIHGQFTISKRGEAEVRSPGFEI